MVAILAVLVLTQAPSPLLGYDRAVRCAGLAQAASELEGGESSRGRRLYDSALFWSIAAMQAAQASGRADRAADQEQTRERLRAVRLLSADDAAARDELAHCLERTPDLD